MTERIFVNQDGSATIVCPECGKLKIADVSKYIELKSSVRIKCKCSCGHSYKADLERRKFVRKKTNLKGNFIRTEDGTKGSMTICDISRSGLKILHNGADRNFNIGEHLKIEFHLDDNLKSFIVKEVVIRKIEKSIIGVEFISMDHYDQLGAYLMFN